MAQHDLFTQKERERGGTEREREKMTCAQISMCCYKSMTVLCVVPMISSQLMSPVALDAVILLNACQKVPQQKIVGGSLQSLTVRKRTKNKWNALHFRGGGLLLTEVAYLSCGHGPGCLLREVKGGLGRRTQKEQSKRYASVARDRVNVCFPVQENHVLKKSRIN